MIKHGFVVCCSLKTGRTLLRRRRRPPCATFGSKGRLHRRASSHAADTPTVPE